MKKPSKKNQDTSNIDITRHVFRQPNKKEAHMSLLVHGEPFEVVNISATGIGISLESGHPFVKGQILDSLTLELGGEILNLRGRMVHISPREFLLIGGIELMDMSGEDQEKFARFLEKERKSLFDRE